jgi:hypothetical protein
VSAGRVGRWALAAALVCAGARSALAQTQVLIVSGLGGEPKYTQEFGDLSSRLAQTLHTRYGVADSDLVWLGEHAAAGRPRYGGESTRENIEAALTRLAARARPGGNFVLVLIGHGSGADAETRISIPGPDLNATAFERLLAPFSKQRVAVLDLTSASGDALAVWAAPGRVVITATKSSYERNESHFAGFFVDALTKGGADADKDGRVSLLEAYRYAVHETARVYSDGGLLQTEHAQLDDMGDKHGAADPTGQSGEGMLARRFFLDAGSLSAVAANAPHLATLYAQRFALTDTVEALIARKARMDTTAYERDLERLLISLARKSREIRSLEGAAHGSPSTGRGGRP